MEAKEKEIDELRIRFMDLGGYKLKGVYARVTYCNVDDSESGVILTGIFIDDDMNNAIPHMSQESIDSARRDLVDYLYKTNEIMTSEELAWLSVQESKLPLE